MAYWLARRADILTRATIKRFDPRFWSVNFARPMMASVTTVAPDALRVDAVFYQRDDLAGLIWEAEDRYDHPLLSYATQRDFRHCQLVFDWHSAGVRALDAINGPVLTIEGRDAQGVARSWYVRLWNYAQGTPEQARISLDFDALDAGYSLADEAERVWAGDIDRMFISLVAPEHDGSAARFDAPCEGWVTLSAIACEGSGSVLEIGDVMLPPHGAGIASGYDDSYHLTPARLLRNAFQLGYRGSFNHYVGMSHYFRLERAGEGLYVSLAGGALNTPCAAWHRDLAARAQALRLSLIISLSFELFDAHCWNDWKQRTSAGVAARTGYTPPSTLLSPAHAGAMGYLAAVARAFVEIAVVAGQRARFQIGEPWWWVMPDGAICLYDNAARAALGGDPPIIASVRAALDTAQIAVLDQAGALLAAATASLTAAVRTDHPDCETLLLAYLPSVLDPDAPELRRANLPIGWAAPAFDRLQLEDYDWVIAGNRGASARGAAAVGARLGYAAAAQHYLAGYIATPDARDDWARVEAALRAAQARGVGEALVWALPQIIRDGFVRFVIGEDQMRDFDDVQFPLALSRTLSVAPRFSTAIVTSAGGHEQRNADWANARLDYDVGPGLRSEADLAELIAFFRARHGAARAFRLRDPFDFSSNGMTGTPQMTDQWLGIGDGATTDFALVKQYGAGDDAEVRRIKRPDGASVLVSLDGALAQGWALREHGIIGFAVAPGAGVVVRAGFVFDVPVRFAEDRLLINSETFAAGEAPSIALIEVREAEGD